MMSESVLTAGMIALAMGLLIGWYALLLRPRPPWGKGALLVTIWMGSIGFLGAWEFFLNEQAIPPRIPFFATFIYSLLLFVVFFSNRGRHLLQNSAWFLLFIQIVRLPYAMMLEKLTAHSDIPSAWSTFFFEHPDFLFGMSAPLIAGLAYRFGERRMRWLIVLWNGLGVFSLLTLVLPLRGDFPWMWWPLFVWPTLMVFHFLSLRRTIRWSRFRKQYS